MNAIAVDCAYVTPAHFVEDAKAFQRLLHDPAQSPANKKSACSSLLREAQLLRPGDPGFEEAGVCLKQVVCDWLDTNRS